MLCIHTNVCAGYRCLLDIAPIVKLGKSHTMRRLPAGLLRSALAALTMAALAGGSVALGAQPAAAQTSAGLHASATAIEAQIASQGQQINLLSERYDRAKLALADLDAKLAVAQGSFQHDIAQLAADRSSLARVAIDSFVANGSTMGIESIVNASTDSYALRREYLQAATGSLSSAVVALEHAKVALAKSETVLKTDRSQAMQALLDVSSLSAQAQAQTAKDEATLAQLKGSLSQLANPRPLPAPLSPAGGSAAVAVQAAESQLGVPYQWGGETPGVGFDCSGLTAWAWGQAGVSLPHSAALQYDDIAHIPMSDLQPGDLIFYSFGGGGIDHVVMYIGGGEVIAAPQTGQNVQIQSLYYEDLVGAGQP